MRTALQDAASVAAMLITTEAMVANRTEKKALAGGPPAAARGGWATWTSDGPAQAICAVGRRRRPAPRHRRSAGALPIFEHRGLRMKHWQGRWDRHPYRVR